MIRLARYARWTVVLVLMFSLLNAVGGPAEAQNPNVDQALEPFKQFLLGIVKWLLGPGRLVIGLAWLVVGFKVVLGMDRGGAGGFIFVALVGMAIVFAPKILAMLGIDLAPYGIQ